MPKISTNKLLPTTLVGSYPQPDWLIDRRRLGEMVPPRAQARELWRVDPSHLEQAQDDATILAIQDQERAGIDIVTDGEIRRESYSNRFATALDGMDGDNPAQIPSRTAGKVQIVPRVVGKIRRRQPVQVRDVVFLRANTDRPIKITIPGPFTMTQQLFDEHYRDEAAVAMDCAIALNDFTGQESGFEIARRLGISFIKIDGTIIGRITRDAEAKARVMTIQQHCRVLDIRTVAMQVESAETLAALRAMRVDYVQGFGIDKPKPLPL